MPAPLSSFHRAIEKGGGLVPAHQPHPVFPQQHVDHALRVPALPCGHEPPDRGVALAA